MDLSEELLGWLDSLKPQLGLRNRGAVLERLLDEVRHQGGDEEGDGDEVGGDGDGTADQELSSASQALDETTAIVLIRSAPDPSQDPDLDPPGIGGTHEFGLALAATTPGARRARPVSGGSPGIQLPGFVRRQARELRRSLEAEPEPSPERSLALISACQLAEALLRAEQHWIQVYGQPANEAVLEAAMVWLARDVWPQSDHSDGRPFTWSLTQQVVSSFAPGWSDGPSTLERVIAAAGILEDPFSGNTLSLRIPTLITRFVQRHRSRQKRTTSFEAIDQTMTVHAALRLLQLPTVADRPYSLQEVREAYREQAQSHHPDAGGSADAMRRLNEAYQFLKERYRRAA